MGRFIGLMVFGCVWAVGCGSEAEPKGDEEPRSAEVSVSPTQPTQLGSPDALVSVQLAAGSLSGDEVTLSVTEIDDSPVPDATIGPVYLFETNGTPSAGFQATLSFRIAADEVTARGGPGVLAVAHGQTVGEMWDELLYGTYTPDPGVYAVQITGFSYYVLVDTKRLAELAEGPREDAGPAEGGDECSAGATQICECAGPPAQQTCVAGRWGTCPCQDVVAGCTAGETRGCTCTDGSGSGTQTCAAGAFGACQCDTTPKEACTSFYDCSDGYCSAAGFCEPAQSCEVDAECPDSFCCNIELFQCAVIGVPGDDCAGG